MERWGPLRNLLRLALLEAFCETARSSVFNIFRTETANLHGVTMGPDRKSQGRVAQQKPELRLIILKAWDDGPSFSLLFLVLNHISEPIKESLIVQSLRGREGRDLRGTQKGCRLGWDNLDL